MGYTLEKLSNKASNYWDVIGKPCAFKALTWIWLSKVTRPALPRERGIKVDKAPPEKNGSE